MIHPQMIPRDANGLVCGAWRLVHERPTFSGELGIVQFKDGTSVRPVAGHVLGRLSAVYGHILFLEPWGDLPPGFRMPEGHSAKVPEASLAKLKRAPWRDVVAAPVAPEPAKNEAASDDLAAMQRADLIALAELHEVEIDKRWGTPKIIAALQSAGITGA
jgi:hypothetical protein